MQDKDDTLPSKPSRSQRKRDVSALQDIGEILVDLPAPQLAKIPLDASLSDAVYAARQLKTREAKRRQLQYIGKLMRDVDVQAIQDALSKIQSKDKQTQAQFHQIERWREKLINDGDPALEALLNIAPDTNRQELRQLIRKAKQDREAHKKSGAETQLFRLLRDLLHSG